MQLSILFMNPRDNDFYILAFHLGLPTKIVYNLHWRDGISYDIYLILLC
jgi:hypothetical protein